ncbi:short chain dehydrogenase [Alphaproteobacteria bacterium]|nr:short chain dehydrogenase [Alphaproteobacteria bacterium]
MKLTNNISNRPCALVTGGAKRIGKNIALKLASLGYDLVIHYHKSESFAFELQKTITENFSVKVDLIQADLFQEQEVKKLVNFMFERIANWSMLINNASIFYKSNFLDDNSDNEFSNNLAIHLLSPLMLIKNFSQNAQQKKLLNCQVINILDTNIERYETKYFYYLLTKQFLAQTTPMIALELAPQIRVNGIALGYFFSQNNDQETNQYVDYLRSKIPLKRIGEIKDLDQTLEFIVNNSFLTGQIIKIDGGASLNHV